MKAFWEKRAKWKKCFIWDLWGSRFQESFQNFDCHNYFVIYGFEVYNGLLKKVIKTLKL